MNSICFRLDDMMLFLQVANRSAPAYPRATHLFEALMSCISLSLINGRLCKNAYLPLSWSAGRDQFSWSWFESKVTWIKLCVS